MKTGCWIAIRYCTSPVSPGCELSEAEVERMAAELSQVLDHIEKMPELDLEGVPPTSHVVDVVNALRPDVPVPSFPAEVVLAAAPERVEGGFGVPSPGASPE